MRMHHDSLINIPLSVVLMSSGYWMHLFESGSWFFGTLLPYLGFGVGCLQLYFLYRKFKRQS